MKLDRNELAANALVKHLREARVGVVVRDLADVDPGLVADSVSKTLDRPLYLAAVDYPITDRSSQVIMAEDIETAVGWRSVPEYAGRIVVFVRGEVPKLHSLSDLDILTARDLANELLDSASAQLSANQPQTKFWAALRDQSAFFPLRMIEGFVQAVSEDQNSNEAIPANLWRLGLLRDDAILDSKKNPAERLQRNREVLLEMAHLSESSRKRMGSVLARATGETQVQLRAAFTALKEFNRRGGEEALKRLDIATVEKLLRAGSPLPNNMPPPNLSKSDDENNGSPEGEVTPNRSSDRPLRGKELEHKVAEFTVSRDPDASDGLRQLGESLSLAAISGDSSVSANITSGFEGFRIQAEMPPVELRRFVGFACGPKQWGGTLVTNCYELKEAIRRCTPDQVSPYDPDNPSTGVRQQCLFSLLRWFDRYMTTEDNFSSVIDRLIEARKELLLRFDLLLSYPLVLFGGFPEARNALNQYIGAYCDLYRLYRQNEAVLHRVDLDAARFIASELLRLEVIHVKTPTQWKAMLTPLHPFHLWKFRELMNLIHKEDRQLTEEEQRQLALALPDLPHLLHVLVFSLDVTGGEDVSLPQSGAIGLLPAFENRTNRYLGADGISFLKILLQRWLVYAPYSKPEIRVGLVDVPDLPRALAAASEFLHNNKDSRAVVDAYFSRGQKPTGDLARLDYDEHDHEIGELFRSGRLKVNLYNSASLDETVVLLSARPVHVAYFFDQSQYHLGFAPRAQQLLVSPLVISYQYEYSPTFKRGTIAPSSDSEEGLFSDYHFLVQCAARMPAGQQLRLKHDPGAELGPINTLLQRGVARWLVVADRVLTTYAPVGAVPLGEQREGQREVAIWSGASSKAVRQFIELLQRFNLNPNEEKLVSLLNQFGHIAAGGIMGLPSVGSNVSAREARQKGLLGTVLAAAWYMERYPGALIASLDSNLARLWLRARPDGRERADLVGLRIEQEDNGTDSVIVEAIEVKTRADNPDVRVERDPLSGQRILAGDAVDQVQAILSAVRPIFGDSDQEPMLTPARREVLKYQVYRECFREIHDPDWQREWYDRLNVLFSRDTHRAPVRCHGLIVHLQMEESGDTTLTADKTQPLVLVRLRTNAVQRLISPVSEQRPIEYVMGHEITDDSCSGDEPETEVDVNLYGNLFELTTDEVAAEEEARSSYPFQRSIDRAELEELVRLFRRACQSYHIQIDDCDPNRAIAGPTVLRLYVCLARGQKLDELRRVLEDIGREMRRSGLILTAVPNSNEVALDIPRPRREIVLLERALALLPKIESPEKMPIPIGVTPEGEDVIRDLGQMPHLLVGGTTGAGKTIFLYGILTALLTTHPDPNTLRILLSTSKPEDFVFFEGLPHLELGRVIADAGEAVQLLENHLPRIFEERATLFREARQRDIGDYNAHASEKLAPIVVIVDEFADLADQLGSNRRRRDAFYTNLRRIAQLGRNRGVHLILCTQRPSADLVPTGIRNLMNVRIALRVNDSQASRMILNDMGAEQLQRHGDLLFKEEAVLTRAQGYFVSTEGLDEVLAPFKKRD